MKRPKIVIAIVTALMVIIFTVSATSFSATSVDQPWEVDYLIGAIDIPVSSVSTALGGENQIPMVSWNVGNTIHHALYWPFPFGNCGPDSSWKCYGISASALENITAGTVSQMATQHFINSYVVGWVYRINSNYLQGVIYEYSDTEIYLTRHWKTLIELSKFGGVLVGTPSLQLFNGDYRVAVTIRDNADIKTYKLVYLYKSGVTNTSCTTAGSLYQCDVIESSLQVIDSPSLSITPAESVGIAYFKGNEIKFAYPHINSTLWPSNCGPGTPQTWRCITIKAAGTGTLGQKPQFTFGATSSKAGIVYTYDDTFIENTLFHADYVGSGGNCGSDKTFTGTTVSKWNCTEVDTFTYLPSTPTPSYSIAMDPEGYSVIAYNNALSDMSPISLYIAYPKVRVGIAEPGWIREKIDGAPTTLVQTGAQAALSLSKTGLGFIGYLQTEDYGEYPALKFARQFEKIYLPLVVR